MKTPFKQKFNNTDPVNNTEPTINLPEITIKAHLKKNLTPQQLKVYDAFYSSKSKWKNNPGFNKYEPSLIAKMFSKTMNVSEGDKSFRAHSGGTKSIGSKNIYVPPNNIKSVIAELSHIFPDISHDPSIKGTVSRFKRVLTGKGGDKSNYKDPNDFEYKTHSGPNSTESKIIKKYANKWGKF